MQVELPPAVSSDLINKQKDEITVIVSKQGDLFVQDRPVAAEDLTQALLEAARQSTADPKVVVVRGDTEAAYGRIIWIMDSARLVGLRNVSLATERPGESGTG